MNFHDLDLEKVRLLVEAGHTDKFLAAFFGVHAGTWFDWRHDNPEFGEKISAWKALADGKVKQALYEKACGYERKVQKVFFDKRTGKVVTVDAIEYYPPDLGACTFWLKNRDPEEFRDKQEFDHTHKGEVAHRIQTEQLDLDERIRQIVDEELQNALQ